MNNNEHVQVLVEFQDPGLEQVGRTDFGEARMEESRAAIEKAFAVIEWIADKAEETFTRIHEAPSQVQLEFGIKISAKAGVLVVQADSEFHIKATLTWKKSSDSGN